MAELSSENQINFEQFIRSIGSSSINVNLYPIHERAIQIIVGDRHAVVVNLPLPDNSNGSQLNPNTPSFFMIQRSGRGFLRMLTDEELEQLLQKIQNNEKDLQVKIKRAIMKEGIKLEINDELLNAIRRLYSQKFQCLLQSQNSENSTENNPRFYSNGRH